MQTLVIDEQSFAIEFSGFSQPLRARLLGDGSAAIELRPWRCIDHLDQLRSTLRVGDGGLELDADAYADAVLDRSAASEGDRDLFRGLALWWASGREPEARREPAARVDGDGWVALDGEGTSARLRTWTWGERLAAQRQHLHVDDDAGESAVEFDPVDYLVAMLERCLVELRGPAAASWTQLDARASRRLLAALVDLNHVDDKSDPLSTLSPALAASTLRLCAALGWTPQQVLAAPAPEVQRLLSLLDKTQGSPPSRPHRRAPAQPRRPSVADHPDAVVILFSDNEGEE
jgi:hypothetical protein